MNLDLNLSGLKTSVKYKHCVTLLIHCAPYALIINLIITKLFVTEIAIIPTLRLFYSLKVTTRCLIDKS